MAVIPYPDEKNPAPEAEVLFGHCEKLLGRVANAVLIRQKAAPDAERHVQILKETSADILQIDRFRRGLADGSGNLVGAGNSKDVRETGFIVRQGAVNRGSHG